MSLYSILCELSGSLTKGNGNAGYVSSTQAWEAPESFVVTEGTTFTHYASPYNSSDVGIIPLPKNEIDSVTEIIKQSPPSTTYPGPLGGAGPLGLFAPKPGSPEYNAYVLKQETKAKYNPEKSGVAPLAKNEKSTAIEINKQTVGPSLWEKFSGAVVEGYTNPPEDTEDPEDRNVFLESIEKAMKALTGTVGPSIYPILLVGGGVLLLIVLVK